MDNSQSEQDQKEELASLYSDVSKSIYGVRLSIDPNDYTLEEMQAELDALDGMEYIYKDEDDHNKLLSGYDDEQEAREPGEHTHDFFDTMDFKKDKAKLRNTSSFKENRKPKMATKTITKSQLRQMIKEAVLKEQRNPSGPTRSKFRFRLSSGALVFLETIGYVDQGRDVHATIVYNKRRGNNITSLEQKEVVAELNNIVPGLKFLASRGGPADGVIMRLKDAPDVASEVNALLDSAQNA